MMEPIAFILMIALYLLPGLIATCNKHANELAVWLLNVLLGWTGLGWVVALVWSVMATQKGK